MIEKIIEIGILFDFYGKLLSARQYSVIESFYILDLSLAEIGDELSISRQSIHDTLKRAELNLYEFEERLGLIKKFKNNNNDISKIIDLSNCIKEKITNNLIEDNLDLISKVDDIRSIGLRILENS